MSTMSTYDYVYTVQKQINATNGVKKTTLKINNKQVQFLVDTGATVDLVDSKMYELVQNQVTLHKRKHKDLCLWSNQASATDKTISSNN